MNEKFSNETRKMCWIRMLMEKRWNGSFILRSQKKWRQKATSNNWSCWFFDLSLLVQPFSHFTSFTARWHNFDPFPSFSLSLLFLHCYPPRSFECNAKKEECKRQNVLLSWRASLAGRWLKNCAHRSLFVLSASCNMLCYWQYARTNCFP